MPKYLAPIVGMKFHPPAMDILTNIPAGTPLDITWEPDNPHDSNAIRIDIRARDIPKKSRANLLDIAWAETSPDMCWHLGYLPRACAAKLRETGLQSATGRLTYQAHYNGPLIEWETEDDAYDRQ